MLQKRIAGFTIERLSLAIGRLTAKARRTPGNKSISPCAPRALAVTFRCSVFSVAIFKNGRPLKRTTPVQKTTFTTKSVIGKFKCVKRAAIDGLRFFDHPSFAIQFGNAVVGSFREAIAFGNDDLLSAIFITNTK